MTVASLGATPAAGTTSSTIGTATPIGPRDNGMAEMVMWYNGAKLGGQIALNYFSTNTTTMFVFPRTPLTRYQAGETNVFWASAQNQFFTLTAITGTNTPAEYVAIHAVDLPKPTWSGTTTRKPESVSVLITGAQ